MEPSTLATILILLTVFCILASLAMGLYYLVKDQGNTKRTVRALTIRITLSILLFVALLVAFAMGCIQPHGLAH